MRGKSGEYLIHMFICLEGVKYWFMEQMVWVLGESVRRREENCFRALRFGEQSSLSQTMEVPETGMPETGEVKSEILRIGY